VLQLGPNARQFLDGSLEVKLRLPDEATVASKTRSSKVAEESWEGVDRGLFDRLRTLRRIVAEERELPAFVVFGDATLRDLARIRPTTLQSMGRIPGIGERKLNELGERFITEIRDHCKERGLDTEEAEPLEAFGLLAYRCRPNPERLREDLTAALRRGALTVPDLNSSHLEGSE